MHLPAPLRAAVGLAATVADEARHLPERAIELPMVAVSTALQMSLRAQQRYAALTARGDEVLSGAPADEPPPWATFDDPLDAEELRRLSGEASGRDAAAILEDIFGSLGAEAAEQGSPAADVATDDDLTPPTPIGEAKTAKSAKSAKKKVADSAAGKGANGSAGKGVSKPRHTKPSKFDDVDDTDA